jgi:hypothetical protein
MEMKYAFIINKFFYMATYMQSFFEKLPENNKI